MNMVMPIQHNWDHDYQHNHALNRIGTIDYDRGKYPFHTQLGS
jgi:hypothetical protein